MPNVLEMQIVSDISSLEKGLKQAEKLQAEYTSKIEDTNKELAQNIIVSNGYKKAVSDLSSEFKKGAISQKEYEKGLENLKRDEQETSIATQNLRKDLATLKKEQKEVGGSFDTASKKVANGGNALMQFSRIAQDAPFGIMGIGNNITATVEAFSHLQKQTGSTGAALKAVAGSIIGSGGILLAVSLVTTALTYMSQSGLSVEDVFDKLTGTFDEFGNSIKKANEEAASSASSQISQFKAYADAAQDANIPLENRLIAVKKLRDIVPYYLKDLSDEQILYGNLSGVIANVTTALLAQARAKAYGSLLDEKAGAQIKVFTEIQEGLNEAVQNFKIPIDQVGDFEKAIKGGTGSLLRYLNSVKKAPITPSDFIDFNALENLSQKYKDLGKLNGEAYALGLKISTETKTALPLDFQDPNKGGGKTKKAKVIPVKAKIIPFNGSELKQADLVTGKLPEITLPAIVLPPVQDDEYLASLDRALQAADIFSNASSASIESLAGSITSSLQTGNAALDAFTGSVIQSLADIAKAQLAGLIEKQALATTSLATDAAVSTGNAVTAATETAAASGPAAAFVLPALVGAAIGFIAASFAGIKFAHGGIVPGGSYTGDKIPAMLNSGEAVMNSQQQANTLMAIANGNSNSLQGNRKSSTFNLESKVIGKDLLLLLKRAEKDR